MPTALSECPSQISRTVGPLLSLFVLPIYAAVGSAWLESGYFQNAMRSSLEENLWLLIYASREVCWVQAILFLHRVSTSGVK